MERFTFEIEGELVGMRLDRAVAAAARTRGVELSNSKAKKLVEGGEVRLDGREAWKASRSVREGQRVEVDIPAELLDTDRLRVSLDGAVVFEDDVLLAVNKPAGAPTHATHDPDRDHVHAAVERLLARQGVSEPYVAVHHRLDVDTSGVLVFGVDRSANKGLHDAFAERLAEKTYLAIVVDSGALSGEFVVDDHLGRDRTSSDSRMRSVDSGGDPATTGFRTLERTNGVALVEARPRTGRTHQIRVHLSELGSPILGDLQYGGPAEVGGVRVERAMLHARSLRIPHPTREGTIQLEAPPPDDFVDVATRLGLTLGTK